MRGLWLGAASAENAASEFGEVAESDQSEGGGRPVLGCGDKERGVPIDFHALTIRIAEDAVSTLKVLAIYCRQGARRSERVRNTKIFQMAFASVYPHYVAKVEKKGRTKEELHEVIEWLTGYDEQALRRVMEQKVDFERFFAEAPRMHPNVSKITGMICGYRVEEIEDPLMRQIRYLDKLVDELAKGRAMEKILRT